MNAVRIYFWKEWREQRATLVVLAVVLLCAVGILAAVLPTETLRHPAAFTGIIGLTLLATLMSIGSDLLARERQLGAIGFLERLPAGLGTVFWGKLCAFLVVLLVALAYGSLLAGAAALLRTGGLPQAPFEELPVWLPAAVLALSLWVFAVSAWMPSGALTFPATLFLLVCLAWPVLLTFKSNSYYPLFRPTLSESVAFLASCIVGAPVSAWTAFVVGSRRGRSRRLAGLSGLFVAALFFLPAWAWAGLRYVQLERTPFKIERVLLGPGGRHAFVTLVRHPSGDPHSPDENLHRSAVVVDLERREGRLAGTLDKSSFMEERAYSRRRTFLEPFLEPGCPRFVLLDRGADETHYEVWDGRTASLLEGLEPDFRPPIEPHLADFGVSEVPSWSWVRWAGLGHVLTFVDDERRRVEIYRDPVSGLVLDRARILSELGVVHSRVEVRVRQGRWLVANPGRLTWVDPTTAETADTGCIAQGEGIGPSVTDGRVLLIGERGVFLLDPETCERKQIRILPDRDGTLSYLRPLPWGSRYGATCRPWSSWVRAD